MTLSPLVPGLDAPPAPAAVERSTGASAGVPTRAPLGSDWPRALYEEFHALAEARLGKRAEDDARAPLASATTMVHETYLACAQNRAFAVLPPADVAQLFAEAMGRFLARRASEAAESQEMPLVAVDPRTRPVSSPRRPDEEIDDWVTLEEAIGALEVFDATRARMARLRLYAGLPLQDVAALFGVSTRSLEREWQYARAWLQNRVRGRRARAG
jgi:hypothetical protein